MENLNENVMEVVEPVLEDTAEYVANPKGNLLRNGLIAATGVGGVYALYRWVVKPLWKKHKAKKYMTAPAITDQDETEDDEGLVEIED